MQLATFSPSETIKPASSNAVKKEAQKKTKTFLVMLLIHCCGDHKTPSFATVTAGKGKQKIASSHRKIMPPCVFKFNYGCQESVDGAVDGSPTLPFPNTAFVRFHHFACFTASVVSLPLTRLWVPAVKQGQKKQHHSVPSFARQHRTGTGPKPVSKRQTRARIPTE